MAKNSGNPRHGRYSSLSSQMKVRSAPRVRQEHSAEYEDLKIPNADEDAYSRISSDSYLQSAAVLSLHKKRKRTKVIVGVLVSLLVVLAIGAGAAFAYMNNVSKTLQDGLDSSLFDVLIPVDAPEDPFYVLLLGTDGSSDRDESGEFGDAYRSDSMMLARIDPKNAKATIVSIPRDTKVDLGTYGEDKINTAHFFGGPTLAVKAVSEFADVPISHYAEIDFDGFREIIDALGGIEVDVPIDIDDPEAGGALYAGKQTLSGEQALVLCRSRHAYDDYGSGDLYRAANQRMVLAAVAQKLLASDPITIATSIQSLAGSVITDMKVEEIVAIAQKMRGMDSTTDIYTAVAPTEGEYEDGVWYQIVDKKAWREMMKRVDKGLPPTTSSEVDSLTGTILASDGSGEFPEYFKIDRNDSIRIRNGSGTDGVCADVQAKLEEMGYSDFDTGNADNFDYETTQVIYKDPEDRDYAKQIVDHLGVGEAIQDMGEYLFESDFLIVVGSDWGF